MSNLTEKEEEFKKKILQMERESLSNIAKTEDKQMVAKIIRTYEESKKNDHK